MKWRDILNFNILSSTLCLINVPDAQKKVSNIFCKENKKILYLSFFLYNSYGARFLYRFFWIAKRWNHLWKYYIAYVVTTFITLLLIRFGACWVKTLGVMLVEPHTFFCDMLLIVMIMQISFAYTTFLGKWNWMRWI